MHALNMCFVCIYTHVYLLCGVVVILDRSLMKDQENLFLTWTSMLSSQMKVFLQYHRLFLTARKIKNIHISLATA